MSWQSDDGEHEMWVAAEFPGGWLSVGSQGGPAGGALVRRPGPDGRLGVDGEPGVLDGRLAAGWRGVCECGWRGPLWQRVTDPGRHDPAARRIHQADPSRYGDAPDDVQDAIWREWKAQDLAPETITAVRQATAAVRAALAAQADAVRAARADGRSWADIGGAAGITRQAAHERWGRHDQTTETTHG